MQRTSLRRRLSSRSDATLRMSLRPLACAALAALLSFAGCASYQPRPAEQPTFLDRVLTQSGDGLEVSVAVLTPDESKEYFGVDLGGKGIQPVWVSVRNDNESFLLFTYSAVDPRYFAPLEAAYKSHFTFGGAANREMDEFFASQEMPGFIGPGEAKSGFVLTNLDPATKYLEVLLFGPRQTRSFRFVVEIPGLLLDWQQVDFDTLYSESEIVDLETEEELRTALGRLPCCTTAKDGSGKGDPLNLVLIGTGEQVGNAFVSQGWDETEAMTGGSAWKSFKAFLFRSRYRTSPMSSLYVFGRGQDAGFQRARDVIDERNHLRVWLTPLRYQGTPVWLGTITRDIGVYFTTKAWNLTTHAIDPSTDEARGALSEDLLLSQDVSRYGLVYGVGEATSQNPHRNMMDAPYWTDGLRAVFLLADHPTALSDLDFFYWDWGEPKYDDEFNRRLQALMQQPGEHSVAVPAEAKKPAVKKPSATFSVIATSVAAGIGVAWGEGELRFQGKRYAFKLSGMNVLTIGFGTTNVGGEVYDLENLADFAGTYASAEAGVALGAGVAGITARNDRGVVLRAVSLRNGIDLSLGPGGFTIELLDDDSGE